MQTCILTWIKLGVASAKYNSLTLERIGGLQQEPWNSDAVEVTQCCLYSLCYVEAFVNLGAG